MGNASENSKFKFDFKVFFVLLLVSAIPLFVGTWWLFTSFEDAYLESAGNHLGEAAEMGFSSISAYLQNQIITTAGLTEVPVLRDTIARGNQDLGRNLEEVRKSIPAREKEWPALGPASPQIRTILDNAGSNFLIRYISTNKSFKEIMVTDFLGRVVSSTRKTLRYYYAQEDWWQEVYGDGQRGSVFIGNMSSDPMDKSEILELAQPFVAPGAGIIGVLKVVLDLQGLHAVVASINPGPDLSAALVTPKGAVVSAPGFTSLGSTPYPGISEILAAKAKEKRFVISEESQPSIYGLTRRDFKSLFPHLDWLLAIRGNVRDLIQPVTQLRFYLVALLAAILIVSLLCTLLVSRVETKPILEEDPHLERL